MKNTTFCYLAGGLSLLGGILALANPFAASLTATVLAGWSFIAVGTLMLIAANHPLGFHLAVFLLGLLVLALGVHLVFDPLRGVVSLTAAVGSLLLVAGIHPSHQCRAAPLRLFSRHAAGFRSALVRPRRADFCGFPAIGKRHPWPVPRHRTALQRHLAHRPRYGAQSLLSA